MKEILNTFFQSNEFWNKFKVELESDNELHKTYRCNYRYKTEFANVLLRFYELQGVKTMTVICNGKLVAEYLCFLSLDELTLILNRVYRIRAANPLCIDSLSITALSCESKMPN